MEVPKIELLRRLTNEYDQLAQVIDQFIVEQALHPGLLGSWSVRDLLAHLIAHEQRAICELQAAYQGHPFPIDHAANDSFNAGAIYACQTLDFPTMRSAWAASYECVVQAVTALPDSEFSPTSITVHYLNDSVDGALANNTYDHYAEHRPKVAQWLHSLQTESASEYE